MARQTLQEARERHNVEGWSDGYYRITNRGTLAIRPLGPDGPEADLHDIVEHLVAEGNGSPVVLRFPQILRHRVDRLNAAFRKALKDNECGKARYRGVFPVKVNQRKEVVQVLAQAGRKWSYGLEVGSKAELMAALTMDPNRRSLLVVNGFKDRAFLEAACDATAFKDEVVIVMDELGELEHLIALVKEQEVPPVLGIRLKLRSKAPGKWALSGGERAKFGLTVPEILHAVARLREEGLLERLQMLHFHVGSQISDIRRIVRGVREAARMHVEMARMGVPLRLLDVGGGLAVDHDGSGSSSPNSANYTIEEYASSVVATIKDVCEEAELPVPDIISESGRAVVTHHAVLVIEVIRRVPGMLPPRPGGAPRDDDPTPLWNLYEAAEALTTKNVFETFHDAVQAREDVQDLFDLGHLALEALGRGEAVFRDLVQRVRDILFAEEETESEEFQQAAAMLGQKLVCNFSLFQSLPDVWGVKQQFPVLPLERLREAPTEAVTLADITCDSDGEIRRFADPRGTRSELEVHPILPGRPYRLAVPLVGAYQDSLGDYHNLFGETAEAMVEVGPEGWQVTRVMDGSRVAEMLAWVRYRPSDMKRRLRERVKRLQASGRVDAAQARQLVRRYSDLLDSPTYLET